ncbi:MAG: hypothetical protein IPG96_13720 [Proteobacteria bacterium]|nr:hypothetical protein [Pseudomonadota bacterium]
MSKTASARAPCASARCAATVQRALFVERAATARIGVVGRNYTIAVELYRGTLLEGSETGRCDVCTVAEAITATSTIAQRAGEAASAGTGGQGPAATLLQPAESPPIEVKGDARPAPKPAARRASAAARSAARRARRATRAPDGPTATEAARPASLPHRWPLWPALAATGMAAVGLAIGLPLIAIDGQGTDCRGPARPDHRNCERLYATAGGGWVMTTVGLASLASAGALLYLYLAPRRVPSGPGAPVARGILERLRVTPAAGGLLVGGGGAF